MDVYDKITDLLSQKGVEFKTHRHEAVRTIEDAKRIAPSLVPALLKTVAFKIKDSFWVLAAVRSRDRIDYRKLAAAFQVNRRQLRTLCAEEVESELGYEVGGVGPIPVREDVKAIFDVNLRNLGKIYCGSGRNTRTLELEFADLLTAAGGWEHPIARESSDEESGRKAG